MMSQPIPTLFVQKDLNVLGAEPSLPEDGVASRATIEAVKNFQTRFKLRASWPAGPETAVAIRYAVGCIYSQDKAGAHLAGGDVFAGPSPMLESAPHAGGYG
jgi:peptidoglycan hydrolase-like protein with peptidoglycan-binding domain